LSIALIIVLFASCSKSEPENEYKYDLIENIGATDINYNGIVLSAGQTTKQEHIDLHNVVCDGDCELNVNSYTIKGTGIYQVESYYLSGTLFISNVSVLVEGFGKGTDYNSWGGF